MMVTKINHPKTQRVCFCTFRKRPFAVKLVKMICLGEYFVSEYLVPIL
jgi:hypothetical protein